MKKTLKRIISSLLVVVMVLTAVPLGVFLDFELPNLGEIFFARSEAATEATFSINLKEETASQVVIEVKLESGFFEALDFGISYNSAKIKKCSKIDISIEIALAGGVQASNPATGLYGCHIDGGYNTVGGVITTYIFEKVAGAKILNDDFVMEVTHCSEEFTVVNNIPVYETSTELKTEKTTEPVTEITTELSTRPTIENTTDSTTEITTQTTIDTTTETNTQPDEPGYEEWPVVKSIEIVKLPIKTTYISGIDGEISTYYDHSYDEYGSEFVTEYEYEHFYIHTDGMIVRVNFTNGTSNIVTNIYNYYYDAYFSITGQNYGEIWEAGTHEVTLSLGNCETTFEVEVLENPIASIEIYELPDKTNLVIGVDSYTNTYYEYSYDDNSNEIVNKMYYEEFWIPTEGLKIKVNFTDGTSEITDDIWNYMDSGFNVTGQEYGEIWEAGNHRVTVDFCRRKATFNVVVEESPVESIEIVKLPETTVLIKGYHDFHNVPTEGLSLKVNYDNGGSKILENVYSGYSCDNSYIDIFAADYDEDWNVGKHNVVIRFCGKETSYEVEVVANLVSKIEFAYLPLKDEYLESEWVDLTGAMLKVYFKDGTNKTLSVNSENYYNWTLDCGSLEGTEWNLFVEEENEKQKKYVFEYRDCTTSFDVNITDKTIERTELLSEPDHPNGVGAKVKLVYSDGSFDETYILKFDHQSIDGPKNYNGGMYKTEKGIFYGFYIYSNLFEPTKTFYGLKLGISEYDEDYVKYTDFEKTFAMLRADSLEFSLAVIYSDMFSLGDEWFNGELTAKNIDALMYTARELVGHLYGAEYCTEEISGDIAKEMLLKVFDIENVDLTLSKFYNSEEDIYTFAISEYGGYGGVKKEIYVIEKYGDSIYIQKTNEGFEGQTPSQYYAFFESDGRCSYFNSTPKKFYSPEPEVQGKVHSVSIDNISLNYKDSAAITPNIKADADVKYTVTYSSSNPSVVAVDSNGTITTRDKGRVTITVAVTDEYGNTVSDTCNIEVKYNWWQWIIVIVLFGWIWY